MVTAFLNHFYMQIISIFERVSIPNHMCHNFLNVRQKLRTRKILHRNKLTKHILPLTNSSLFDIFGNYKQAIASFDTYIVPLIFSDFSNLNGQLIEQTFSDNSN